MPSLPFALAAALTAIAAAPAKSKSRPPAPPSEVAVPSDPQRPLLSNPQLSLDGKKIYVARTGLPSAPLAKGLDVLAIPLGLDRRAQKGAKVEVIHFAIPVRGNQVRLMLSSNDKLLAVLSEGEVWLKVLGETAGPKRLYPPEKGDAPLGPQLRLASLAADSTWLLAESALGWGRLGVPDGQVQVLPLRKFDLAGASLAMSPDGQHAALAKPQRGEGYVNGSHVLAINITSDFAQGLDSEHLYTEVLFLPDGHPLGKEAGGELWLLRPKSRLEYFTPPPVARGATIENYAVNFAATKLAWVVTSDLSGKEPSAQLWVAGAPATPQPKDAAKEEE